MRPIPFALLAGLAACSTDADVQVAPTPVIWMEWPAQVLAGEPFGVRVILYGASGCTHVEGFVLEPEVDASAVSFEPYYLLSRSDICVAPPVLPLPALAPLRDTTVTVPGLAASATRTYEIRGSQSAYTFAPGPLPLATFGVVTVGPTADVLAVTNAGGSAYASKRADGCTQIWAPFVSYVLENPPDTTNNWSAFVRGYVYRPAAPLCGDTVAFHLISRN